MKTTIGRYDSATRSVPVVFDPDGIAHARSVNACHLEDGSYDRKGTVARVAEVALGVAVKANLGVIGNTLEPEAPAA